MEIDPSVMLKIRAWCARQERSQSEVKRKLYTMEVPSRMREAIVALLIEEGYLNESRFAEAFVSGKSNIKGWGKRKILQGLRQRGVDEKLAQKALSATDQADYVSRMHRILEQYTGRLKEPNSHARKTKTARYLLQKGYEPELVWEAVNRYFA